MAHTNHAVSGVRTVYLPCKPALVSISSRFIREIAQYGGDVSALVPPPVAAQLSRVHPRRRDELRPILTAEMTYDDKHDEFEDDEEFDDSDAFVRSTNGYVGDAEALLRRADRHHRLRADDAAVVVAAHRPRRDHRAARGVAASPARRDAPGALDDQGAPGVRRQDPARGRRAARGGARAGRADGAAHRGRACRRAACPPDQRGRRGRSRRLRHETEDFLDQRLGSFEILLDKLQKTVHAGRSAAVDRRSSRATRSVEEDDPTRASSTRIADSSPAVNLDVMSNPLLINAAELLRRPGSRATRRAAADASPSSASSTRASIADATVEVVAAAGIADRRHRRRRARSTSPWPDSCRRCLAAAAGDVRVRGARAVPARSSPIPTRSRSSATRSTSARWSARTSCSRLPMAPLCRPTAPGCARRAASTSTLAPCDCVRDRRSTRGGRRSSQLKANLPEQ